MAAVDLEQLFEFIRGKGRRLEHGLYLMLEGKWEERCGGLEFERVATESKCRMNVWRQLSVGVIKCDGEVIGVYGSKYVRDEETSDGERMVYAIFKGETRLVKVHEVRSRTEWGSYEKSERFPAQPEEFEEACRLLEALEARERR
jgi:hypothetical protein